MEQSIFRTLSMESRRRVRRRKRKKIKDLYPKKNENEQQPDDKRGHISDRGERESGRNEWGGFSDKNYLKDPEKDIQGEEPERAKKGTLNGNKIPKDRTKTKRQRAKIGSGIRRDAKRRKSLDLPYYKTSDQVASISSN